MAKSAEDYKKLYSLLRRGDIILTNLDGSQVTDKRYLGMYDGYKDSSGLFIQELYSGQRMNHGTCPALAVELGADPEKVIFEIVCPVELQSPTGTLMDNIMKAREGVNLLNELANVAVQA